jgi:hypothetical protein
MRIYFDNTPYTGAGPRCDAASAIGLVQQLVVAAPAALDVRTQGALDSAVAAGHALEGAINDRDRSCEGRLRPVLVRFDAAWGAMEGRLAAAIRIPDPISERASALHGALFDGGLSFLVGDALTKHTESGRRLRRIEEDLLVSDLESLAGRAFVDAVKREHRALGEAIGIGREIPRPASTIVAEGLAEVQYAIWWYCIQLIGMTDFTSEVPVEALRKALRPIDDYRAAHPHRASEPPAGPVDPVAVVLPKPPALPS